MCVFVDGEKQYMPRIFDSLNTRGYCVFKVSNLDISTALPKFYSCRPKWVLLVPHQEVCLCVYCADAKLYVCALKCFMGDAYTIEYYERWNNYKNMGAPATYTVWENGDTVNKT